MKNANLVSLGQWWRRALIGAVLTLAVTGCGGETTRDGAAAARTGADTGAKSVRDFFPIRVGDATVRMQIAVTPAEMQRGLMGRTDLGPNDGMLFVYDTPKRMSFWMKNTPTPLDIGFFTADGELREVYQLFPYDETPVASYADNYLYALETNQGWFKANGLKSGARLDMEALRAALQARRASRR